MIDSLREDDGNGNDVTDQKHDWLNERNNRAARAARAAPFLVQFLYNFTFIKFGLNLRESV